MKTRRVYAAGVILLASSLGFGSNAMTGRAPEVADALGQIPQVPQSADKDQQAEGPPLANAEKKTLEENDKDMKKKVNRLYELATELKAEVDKTDSSKVLSLNLMKKAEEIEKLARDIKNRSKG
jgi:hypothetical protein